MPAPLVALQKRLLKQPGGDRVMAQLLSAIPQHGLDAVVATAVSALETGMASGEHVLNLLARLTQPKPLPHVPAPLTLTEEPKADVARYDQLLQPEVNQ
jgi:hypothetical protein